MLVAAVASSGLYYFNDGILYKSAIAWSKDVAVPAVVSAYSATAAYTTDVAVPAVAAAYATSLAAVVAASAATKPGR